MQRPGNSILLMLVLMLFLSITSFSCASQETMVTKESSGDMGASDGMKPEMHPDWAKDAIWYQIFPERFRNGDTSNDPKATDSPKTAIIDGVFNHVGNTFWAFEDVINNQQRSPYADWSIVTKWDDPATEEFEFDYESWWGVKSLPLVNEDEMGPVTGPREYTFEITIRWMAPV